MRPPRPRARAATPAGARTETRRPEEAEARSGDPPASPTVSLAPPSGAPYLRPREPESAETGGDLPRPRRRRAGPRVRGVPGAEVRRRQQVFKEGEPGNRLFIISEGEVRI